MTIQIFFIYLSRVRAGRGKSRIITWRNGRTDVDSYKDKQKYFLIAVAKDAYLKD